jgi:hypothetical protein
MLAVRPELEMFLHMRRVGRSSDVFVAKLTTDVAHISSGPAAERLIWVRSETDHMELPTARSGTAKGLKGSEEQTAPPLPW